MSRVLTGDAALRREERLQKRENRLTDKTSDLRAQIASLTEENERLRFTLSKLLYCVNGIHTKAYLERCITEAATALQPKEGNP